MSEDISADQLLIQLKHGHMEALNTLYPQYAKQFYHYARKKGLTHEEAEDVVGDTWKRILEGMKTYTEAKKGGAAWMWTICNNLTSDILRQKQKPTGILSEHIPASEDTNPETCLEQTEISQIRLKAWEELSEEDRKELRRGRGRGPERKGWREARKRLRTLLFKKLQYEEPKGDTHE